MKCAIALSLFFAVAAAAQPAVEDGGPSLLLRNESGTASNPGPLPRNAIIFGDGTWTGFFEGAAFATYVNETGPVNPPNELFSTNWVTAGAQALVGNRATILFRVRASGEPFTIKRGGYPQLLQAISPENGGPLVDRMRPHDLLGEAAVDLGFRLGGSALLHLYAAPVGDPALGALPYAQRASASEFAEAPFAYDIQESLHHETRVVTVAIASPYLSLEGSVFHRSIDAPRFTAIEDGKIDSWSGRIVVTPIRNLSLQASHGELGDTNRSVSSGSISIGSRDVAASGIWTRREMEDGVARTSMSLELLLRTDRATIALRGENVDTPPFATTTSLVRRSHVTAEFIFDAVRTPSWRAGLGAELDYHTKFRQLGAAYGHKPQAAYLFLRVRTDAR